MVYFPSSDPISNLDSSSNTPAHLRPAEGTTGDQSTLFDEATVNLGSQTNPATTPNSTSQLTQSVTTAAAVSESSKSKSNSSMVDESTTPLASNVDSTSD